MQVLLIDDSATSRLYTQQALLQALPGIGIQQVSSGRQAQDWLLLNNADLLICDLEMEDGDGVELIHWLRQQPAFRDLRVLVHSSHVDMLVKAVLHRYQPVAFLSKPATPADLNAAVQTLWRGERHLTAA